LENPSEVLPSSHFWGREEHFGPFLLPSSLLLGREEHSTLEMLATLAILAVPGVRGSGQRWRDEKMITFEVK
jgi:hypothetical protein